VSREINYMLRKTLVPWRFAESIDEVVRYCKANGVTEVMWKVDTEVFNRGFTPISLIEEYIPWLKKGKNALSEINVVSSINPWMTLNHADYGRDSRGKLPDMYWMVGHDGTESIACACPLSDSWQRYIVEAYSLYAQTKPNILWLEDDFRHFNHKPIDWGCFCPIHIERFSEHIGEKITREKLVECILKPGPPHPLRRKWMDFLGDNMVKVAAKIEKAVHTVSPETKLGLMSSSPEDHSIEGRKWHKLLKTLAGRHQPVCRPAMGSYRSIEYFDIYNSMQVTRKTTFCLPPGTKACAEIENAPFTEFVKSVRFTRMQILLAAAAGCDDITMNLYDHAGTPLQPDDPYGLMLRNTKSFLNGLLQYRTIGGKEKGIGILFAPHIAQKVQTNTGTDFTELYPNASGWFTALQALGHAVTYQQSDVVAITGQITRGYRDEQIKNILSKAVLLDAFAAKTLAQDGYGQYIGVNVGDFIKRTTVPISAEDFGAGVYISARLATEREILCRLKPQKGASVFSNFVDCNRDVFMPAVVFFENSLGGRVAVFAMDMRYGATCCFMSWHRKRQFKQILDWLTNDNLDLFVSGGPHSLPMRTDYDNYSIVTVANNSPDTWPNITIEFATSGRRVREILILDRSGKWLQAPCSNIKQNSGRLIFKVDSPLEYMDLAAFCLKY